MRYAFASLLLLHGTIHLIAVASAFGWAKFSSLQQYISRAKGFEWLAAALLLMIAGTLLLAERNWWWVFAVCGALLSQWLIASVWKEARFGTIANALILLPLIMAVISRPQRIF